MSRPRGFLAVILLVSFGAFAVGCGGGDDGATQEQLDAARAEGAKEARDQAKLNQLQKQVKQLQKKSGNGNSGQGGSSQNSGSSGSSTGSSGPVSSCADGVRVGPNTSCSFAMNVAGEYGSNPGASNITAYSPVTGEYYSMNCGPWSGGTVCSGGNGAAVYLP